MSNDSFFGHADKETRDAALKKLDTFLKETELSEFKEQLEYIERLEFITSNMKRELMSENDLRKIAICFKYSTTDFLKKFFEGLTSNLKQEILYGLQGKYTLGEVMKTVKEFTTYLKKKEAEGSLVLDKDSSEKYV